MATFRASYDPDCGTSTYTFTISDDDKKIAYAHFTDDERRALLSKCETAPAFLDMLKSIFDALGSQKTINQHH